MGHADDADLGSKRPKAPQPWIYLFRLVRDDELQSQTFLLIRGMCRRRNSDRRHHELSTAGSP
jgi:hypothetical protein